MCSKFFVKVQNEIIRKKNLFRNSKKQKKVDNEENFQKEKNILKKFQNFSQIKKFKKICFENFDITFKKQKYYK